MICYPLGQRKVMRCPLMGVTLSAANPCLTINQAEPATDPWEYVSRFLQGEILYHTIHVRVSPGDLTITYHAIPYHTVHVIVSAGDQTGL